LTSAVTITGATIEWGSCSRIKITAMQQAVARKIIFLQRRGRIVAGAGETMGGRRDAIGIALLIGVVMMFRCPQEAGEAKADGNAASDEEAGIAACQVARFANQLVGVTVAQAAGELRHAAGQLLQVVRHLGVILLIKFGGRSTSALCQLIKLVGSRLPVLVELRLAHCSRLLGAGLHLLA
jgi:hypothetical protein